MTVQGHPGTTAAAPQHLCPAEAVQEGGAAWVWQVLEHSRPVRAFVLRFDGRPRAYLNRCLHVPTEMDWQEGRFFDLDRRWILCSVHGATYDPVDGRCVGGPCGRGRLTALEVREQDGQLYWYPSAAIRPVVLHIAADRDPQAPEPSGAGQ